jgi:transposase
VDTIGTRAKGTTERRRRRTFSEEFKAGAVRLVLDEGKTIAQVARDLDLTPSAPGGWVEEARADWSKGKTGVTTEERAELANLRQGEPRVADAARHSKKAGAFFAKQST